MKKFRGTYTVMVTPFDVAGEVDADALKDFVNWQIAEGIDGLIPQDCCWRLAWLTGAGFPASSAMPPASGC